MTRIEDQGHLGFEEASVETAIFASFMNFQPSSWEEGHVTPRASDFLSTLIQMPIKIIFFKHLDLYAHYAQKQPPEVFCKDRSS